MTVTERYKDVFEAELLLEMERKGEYRYIKAGETILNYGQLVRTTPIILSGTVRVSRMNEKGDELLLYYVQPFESCAMTFTCCMQHFPSEIRAEAEDDVELLAVPVSVMDEWLAKYPTWKSFVMKTIRSRFQELLTMVDQVAFQMLDERLVRYLKEKSKATGSALIHVSHEQIAKDLASSRVVVSRLLKKLEDEKKLLLYRNQIRLMPDL